MAEKDLAQNVLKPPYRNSAEGGEYKQIRKSDTRQRELSKGFIY